MTTMSQRRSWQGPAVFSYGFRPFFFGGALLSAVLLAVWIPWYFGVIQLPSALSPSAWHAHELLFGYVPAIIAGFLLTAVPNWTGRLPIVGYPLAGLFVIWLAGRLAVLVSAYLPSLLLAAIALGFLVCLTLAIGREIVASRNWKNAKVLAVLGVLSLAQALFLFEALNQGRAVYGQRIAIAAILMLIMIVGGRIVPSFTRNWIKRENPGPEPAVFGAFDQWSMVLGGVALAVWALLPALHSLWPQMDVRLVGVLLLAAGALHLIRLWRWVPQRTLSEPIVAVLHLGYFFVPLGFLLSGAGMVLVVDGAETAAIHAWTIGAVGIMTLAVMTRATRGHTGQPLKAPFGTVVLYLAVMLAAILRILAVFLPESSPVLLPIAGGAWGVGFFGFCLLYGPMLLQAPDPARG